MLNQWEVVRELRLDLSEMLAQYRDCFSEVSRQTRWYRDLREAYQDLRSHAENVKREALLTVNSSQREVDALKRQFNAQSLQLCQLKEQLWEAEQGRQRAESETEELQGRLENYSQQICQFKSRLESLQTQLKETQARMEMSEEQVELRRLRDFRDIWERVARSLADVHQQDKDCWSGLQWCESTESEDRQKREAKLEATLGLLLVEAGRRHRANASGGRDGDRDAVVKDCDSGSTDGSASGSASASSSTRSRDREAKTTSTERTEGAGAGTGAGTGAGAGSDTNQGQLQGVLEENQQLRGQLGQLRAHNASLASQEQYEESARCLADLTSSLEAEAETGAAGQWPGDALAPRTGTGTGTGITHPISRVAGLVSRRDPLAALENVTQPSLSASRRAPGPGVCGRVSRASSSGGSSGGRLFDHHHDHHHQRRHRCSPDLGASAPWDYSDHADLCDSGFW
ncbi:Golgin subfamily A member 3, partial [Frankliniella fusca]